MSRRSVPGARMIVLKPGGRILPVVKPQEPHCAHQQAEPVVLSSGETVACVCITCFSTLSADYIAGQRERAESIANCSHEDLIDITQFGKVPGSDLVCAGCGSMNPGVEW
jgi:hypothetical protein